MNDRSELVTPANFSGGGVLESTRRFHTASAASIFPARRPTRGSGIAELDRVTAVAQPTPDNNASESDRKVRLVDRDVRRARKAEAMFDSSEWRSVDTNVSG